MTQSQLQTWRRAFDLQVGGTVVSNRKARWGPLLVGLVLLRIMVVLGGLGGRLGRVGQPCSRRRAFAVVKTWTHI